MLIEKKSTEILSLCDELDKLQKNQRNARDFNKIEKELIEIVEGIEPISKTVIALANALNNDNVANPIPSAPKEVASLLHEALIIAADNEFGLATIDFQKIRVLFNETRIQLIDRANNDWSTLKIQHVSWPEDLLKGLESIGLRTEVKNLRNCEQDLQDTTRSLPKGKGDIENFLRSVQKYQLATKDIDLPESIKKFLQDATRGALLDSLTPDVKSWLLKNHLLNKFAIRFA